MLAGLLISWATIFVRVVRDTMVLGAISIIRLNTAYHAITGLGLNTVVTLLGLFVVLEFYVL